MKQLINKKLKPWQTMLVSLLSTCGILFIMLIKCGVCFETNDDRIFSEIFSGVLTGKPDPHGIYVNYLLGSLIAALFSLTRSIQWWGVFLILCFVMIFTVLLFVILHNCKNMFQQIWLWLLGCLIIVANVYIFSVIQFTTVAGVLAVAGYVYLLGDNTPARKYMLFGIFEFFAILLRQESMLMIQPIGLCVVMGFLVIRFLEEKRSYKQCTVELVKCILVPIFVIVLAYIGNNVIGDYSSPEWQEYKRYNELNVNMADYYGYPSIQDCKDILDKYNVSEAEYRALTKYLVLDNKFEAGFLEELSELAKNNYKQENPTSLINIIKRILTYPKYDNCYGYEVSVTVMYTVVCLWILLSGKLRYILPVITLCGSKNIVFAYLIYRGRVPHRVVNILFVAELLLLVAIGVRVLWDTSNFKCGKKLKYIMGIVIVAAMLYSAKLGGTVAVQKNTNTMLYAEYIQQLFNYCAVSDGGILISDEVITYYTGHALDVRRYQGRNFLVTGGWFSNSPMMDEAIATYRKEHPANMKCITFFDVSGWDNSYVLEYFEEKYNLKPDLVEIFSIEELGLNYAVYQLY